MSRCAGARTLPDYHERLVGTHGSPHRNDPEGSQHHRVSGGPTLPRTWRSVPVGWPARQWHRETLGRLLGAVGSCRAWPSPGLWLASADVDPRIAGANDV